MPWFQEFEESMGDTYDRILQVARRLARRILPPSSTGIVGFLRRRLYADEKIESAVDAIGFFQRQGYYCRFTQQPAFMQCLDLELIVYPDEFDVQHFYRFPDKQERDTNIIVYALRTNKGIKGIYVGKEGKFLKDTNPELVEKLRMRL